MPIAVSIDVSKIDKSKFFIRKNGAKMLDLILLETPNSKYDNDYLVKQGQSKADRDAGIKTPILGNARILESKKGGSPASAQQEGQDNDGW